jgi:hypothetical protein
VAEPWVGMMAQRSPEPAAYSRSDLPEMR